MKDLIENAKYSAGAEMNFGTTLPFSIVVGLEIIRAIWTVTVVRAICKVFGHTYIDDSYANADHGNVSYHCERCGEGYYSNLY